MLHGIGIFTYMNALNVLLNICKIFQSHGAFLGYLALKELCKKPQAVRFFPGPAGLALFCAMGFDDVHRLMILLLGFGTAFRSMSNMPHAKNP